MEILLFLIMLSVIFFAIWKVFQSVQSSNNSTPNRPHYRSNRSSADAYLFQAQVARSQHNRSAENFFMMGAMDAASEPDDEEYDEENDEEPYDDYNEEEYYDESDQV